MVNPELEKKLRELRAQKKELVRKFTRQSVDAINQSEKAALTQMSIMDSDSALELKTKKPKKTKKKEKVEVDSKENT